MGYMGFGMRKEVYTRKPKEAFKKVKQVYKRQAVKGTDFEVKPVSANVLKRVREKMHEQSRIQIYKNTIKLTFAIVIGVLMVIYGSDVIIWWFG